MYKRQDLYWGDIRPHGEDAVNISAKTGEGLDELLRAIDKLLDKGTRRVTLHIPYDKAGLLDVLYKDAKVESVEYGETIDVRAICNPRAIGLVKPCLLYTSTIEEQQELVRLCAGGIETLIAKQKEILGGKA